jgi:glycosyltransferase involved in cell wall biosynthesis
MCANFRNQVLVGFAGRFVEEKGFDVLLKAIHKIAMKRKDIHFVYAGSENIAYENFYDRNKHLWEQVNAHVTKLGLLNGEAALNAFYKNLDLFVLPSRSDTFALVQAEAMGHGVPCIVTDIPGARWLVKTSGFGIIAEPENEDSPAEAILHALTRKKELNQKRPEATKLLDPSTFFKQFSVLEARIHQPRSG